MLISTPESDNALMSRILSLSASANSRCGSVQPILVSLTSTTSFQFNFTTFILMSIQLTNVPDPDTPDTPFDLTYLNSDWKRATLWMAFLEPKTQQDAIRYIYHGQTKGVPENWIIAAKRELLEREFIIKTDQEDRNSIYSANTEPIIRSILSHVTYVRRRSENVPGQTDCIRKVLDSQCFRGFFSYGAMTSPLLMSDKQVYGPFDSLYKPSPQNKSLKLEIRNLTERLFAFLWDIGYYSHNIRWLLLATTEGRKGGMWSDEDASRDLLLHPDFDSYLAEKYSEIPDIFPEVYCRAIRKSEGRWYHQSIPIMLYHNLLTTRAGCLIPMGVSEYLRGLPHERKRENHADAGLISKLFDTSYHDDPEQYRDFRCLNRYLTAIEATSKQREE